VAGKGADNLGMQLGGWSISWQGDMGSTTPGTTILEAVKATVADSNLVQYSVNGSDATGDVAIVVVGEEPYAEMKGDRDELSLNQSDLDVISTIQAKGIPVIIVLISGRPMLITDQLPQWDALLAAWLPGTEGQGIADVLFGDYSPTGKLSFAWPRSMDQLPFTSENDHLFEIGHGLHY
ncbi:MAG TPA: beta-glucosidase, partial [Candidatus Marinimicrobia bacterium]|nr:beta-glucosidase [Candidatus Neomarinimicrobiota bacterium]